MKKFSTVFHYFITGIGYGAITYLCFLTFVYAKTAPTVKGVISVFTLSGLIGILSMIYRSDIPLTIAIGIHFVGTIGLFMIMILINHWYFNIAVLIIFILVYMIIWIISIFSQKQAIERINQKLKKRKAN